MPPEEASPSKPALASGPAPLRALRQRVARGVTDKLGTARDATGEYTAPAGDPGIFGPGSLPWRVHGDLPAMLIGGISSLMLQTLHPLAMAGVADHSHFREDPIGRLRRTARFVAGTTFGGTPLADSLFREVRRVHASVYGFAPDGRPYTAEDPALLCWVHTTEVWSFLRSYQRYSGRPLTIDEKDRYLDEVAVLGERLGARQVPRSVHEVRAYLRAVRPQLCATAEALDAVRFLRAPVEAGPGESFVQRVLSDAAADLLPRFAREMLMIGEIPLLTPLAVRVLAAGTGRIMRWAVGPSVIAAVATERARSVRATDASLALPAVARRVARS